MFLFASIVFTVGVCIILLFARKASQFPPQDLLVNIFLFSAVIMPALVAIAASVSWYLKHKQQHNYFKIIQETHLIPNGFTSHIIDADSKWNLAREVYQLEIADEIILFLQSSRNNAEVELSYCKQEIGSNRFYQKSVFLKKREIMKMTVEEFKSILYKNKYS